MEPESLLGLLATNVVIVTSTDDGQPHGCTTNAWGEPEAGSTLLITLSRSGATRDVVLARGLFGISILSIDQRNLAFQFAKTYPDPRQRFDGVDLDESGAVPVIAHSLATLICEVEHSRPFGQYDAIFATITSARSGRPASPLIHFDGHLGHFHAAQPIRIEEST